MRKLMVSSAAALSVVAMTALSSAPVQAQTAGKSLTPVGAEKSANADASIPAFTGGELKAPAGWKAGQPRPNPYASEKPLVSITKANAAQYQANLTPGQLELLNSLPGYRLDIYPTHRSCGYPDFVYKNSEDNLKTAKLAANGYELAAATPAGFPFPQPKSGVEAIWNYKLRYMGEGRTEPNYTLLSPGRGGSDIVKVRIESSMLTPFGNPKAKTLADVDGVEFKFIQEVTEPAARVGEITLGVYHMDKTNEGWIYMPGQRRVKRLSTYAYDAPLMGLENTYYVDQAWMYNGMLDRYDYKLVGKKELYVPYNTFELRNAKRFTAKTLFGPQYPNRDAYRYEKHRVWVVEATVKAGQRHAAPKRTFYLDEDSWTILLADLYDSQGKISRVQEGSVLPAWELGACVTQEFFSYDLNSGRYFGDVMVFGEPETDWLAAVQGRIKKDMFTESYLQRAGSR